jgi:hypothetical protein
LSSFDVDSHPINPFSKHHLHIHHSQNGEGTFVAFKKRFLVDVLAHLYAPFLENWPLAMMHVGLICLALQLVPMWKTLTNVAPFNVCLTSLKGPWFGPIFPSIKGLLGLVEEDVEPLLSRSACSFLPLPLVLPSLHLACRSTEHYVLS